MQMFRFFHFPPRGVLLWNLALLFSAPFIKYSTPSPGAWFMLIHQIIQLFLRIPRRSAEKLGFLTSCNTGTVLLQSCCSTFAMLIYYY